MPVWHSVLKPSLQNLKVVLMRGHNILYEKVTEIISKLWYCQIMPISGISYPAYVAQLWKILRNKYVRNLVSEIILTWCWTPCYPDQYDNILFNPIALRMAKILWSCGCSECSRVNQKQMTKFRKS